MRAWLVMLTIVVGAAGCDGGWRPSTSREADALWLATRHCDQQIWKETTLERLRIESDVARFPSAQTRLDRALDGYARAPECDAGCRTRLASITASTTGAAECEAAARLVRDTSLAGHDREPELKARGQLLARWFLSSYWVLVALGLIGAIGFGKLDSDDAFGVVAGCIGVYGLVRLLARIPATYWFIFVGVLAFAIGIVLVSHFRKISARGLGILELVVAFATFVVALVGWLSLNGNAAYAAAIPGLLGAIITGGHGLHTLQHAKPEAKAAPKET